MTVDTNIRSAFIKQIGGVVPVFEKVVPIGSGTPNKFIVITAQGRKTTAVSKQNYEWMSNITVTLVYINERGFYDSAELDQLDNLVCSVLDGLVLDHGYRVGNSKFIDSVTESIDTPTQTVARKHIIYELWVNRI